LEILKINKKNTLRHSHVHIGIGIVHRHRHVLVEHIGHSLLRTWHKSVHGVLVFRSDFGISVSKSASAAIFAISYKIIFVEIFFQIKNKNKKFEFLEK